MFAAAWAACICVPSIAVCSTPAVPGGAAAYGDIGTINPLIGDISFLARFGRLPNTADDERMRIGTHLLYVESMLRVRDVSHLSPWLRAARARNLDLLHEYAVRGVFPLNERYRGRRPCFIDNHGTICAVGYLVERTAGYDAAEEINRSFQYATIAEMHSPVLDAWLCTSGLTPAEAATIQPTYGTSVTFVMPTLTMSVQERRQFRLKGEVRSLTTHTPAGIEQAEFSRWGYLTGYERREGMARQDSGSRRSAHPVVRTDQEVVLLYVTTDSALVMENRRYGTKPSPTQANLPVEWNTGPIEEIEYVRIRHGERRVDSVLRYVHGTPGRAVGLTMIDSTDATHSVRFAYDTVNGAAVPALARFGLGGSFPSLLDDIPPNLSAAGTADTCLRRYTLKGTDTVAWDICDNRGNCLLTLERISEGAVRGTARTFNGMGDPVREQRIIGTSIAELAGGGGEVIAATAYAYWYDDRGNWTKRRMITGTILPGGVWKDGGWNVVTREIDYW